ncbi:MAG: ABC transporter [Propionibacteriaceae bacterium]|nr:ABC transporter [Propionibacteriaceae bacterium]MBT67538.1 ABC transporter [Synechococcus sp. NP17]|tara:strand:- start:712 stop:2355 length:1644 start_codon:yes stop_codon:yes gene_type:complete
MSVLSVFDGSSRALEIVGIVSRHEWSFLSQLLNRGDTSETRLPLPSVLCNILTELGPVYVKLGQLLSTRPDLLGEDYIEALSQLQSDVPAVPWEQLRPQLEQELGCGVEEAFSTFIDQPIAAGSVGQVYKAILPDIGPVAVKVLRPGIAAQVEEDGRLLRKIAYLASATSLGSLYDFVGLADQVLEALVRELDFRIEASNTLRLQRCLDASSFVPEGQIRLPHVVQQLSSRTVLVLEWIEGAPILSAEAKKALEEGPGFEATTTALLGAFVEQYFVEGFFHADPHPGNLKVLADGKVILLDAGMVGLFDPRTRSNLLDLVLALINQDGARATDVLEQIAPPVRGVKVDRQQLQRQLDQLIAKSFSKPLEELNFALFLAALLQLANRSGLRVPGTLGLFVKSVTNLEGVGNSLNPAFSFTGEMQPLVAQLLARAVMLPQERLMQFGLDLRNLTIDSPRQLSQVLRRFSSDELVFAIQLEGLDAVRSSLEQLSQRVSLAILVASLLLSATVMATLAQQPLLRDVSEGLFVGATLFGLWLIVSLLRSSRR